MNQEAKTIKLGLTDNHSDKVYLVSMLPSNDNTWGVYARYGKRFNVNNKTTIAINLCYAEACEIFNRTIDKKIKKGYLIES